MAGPLELSVSQRFEIERWARCIDNTGDVRTLQGVAKQLLQLWQQQKAATDWAIKQGIQPWAQVKPGDLEGELREARAAAGEIDRLNRLLGDDEAEAA
jgi:hypothetical protein